MTGPRDFGDDTGPRDFERSTHGRETNLGPTASSLSYLAQKSKHNDLCKNVDDLTIAEARLVRKQLHDEQRRLRDLIAAMAVAVTRIEEGVRAQSPTMGQTEEATCA